MSDRDDLGARRQATGPTLYDVLDVTPGASAQEVHRAWRRATDELGHTGSPRRLQLLNQAAETLLDPERRAEYDATLPEPESRPEPESPPASRPAPAERPPRGGPSTAVLVVLGLLAAVAVGLAAYFVTQQQEAEAYQEALDRAPSAAENAALAVLAYDHRSLEADRDAAAKFLTEDYRAEYVETFDNLVAENATDVKATVEAEVLASAPMTAGSRDGDTVPVLLFVDQTTTKGTSSGEPSVALNRVRFDMVEVDGTWLVDGITSY